MGLRFQGLLVAQAAKTAKDWYPGKVLMGKKHHEDKLGEDCRWPLQGRSVI